MIVLAILFWVLFIIWVILGVWVNLHSALTVAIPTATAGETDESVMGIGVDRGPRLTVPVPAPHVWIRRLVDLLLAVLILLLGLRVFV
jgi:hypothetical protein